MNQEKTCLPDFIIIGAQKCGTGALKYYLGEHPQIYMNQSELHYFDRKRFFRQGIEFYSRFFPNPEAMQGEKTPKYICSLYCHERMYQAVPHARLILLLRNPCGQSLFCMESLQQKK